MREQEPVEAVGFTGMSMTDIDLGIIHRFEMPVNSPREVYVLHVHKEAFVKKADFFQGLHAKKHKASGEIGRLKRAAIVLVAHFISHQPLLEYCLQKF